MAHSCVKETFSAQGMTSNPISYWTAASALWNRCQSITRYYWKKRIYQFEYVDFAMLWLV